MMLSRRGTPGAGTSGRWLYLTSDARCPRPLHAFGEAIDDVLGAPRSALDRAASLAGGISDLLEALRGQVAMRLLAGVTKLPEARHWDVDQDL